MWASLMSSHWLAKETCPTCTTRKGVRWYNPHPLLNPYIYTLKNSQNFLLILSSEVGILHNMIHWFASCQGQTSKCLENKWKKLWNYYFARIFQLKHVKKLLYKSTVIQNPTMILETIQQKNYKLLLQNYYYDAFSESYAKTLAG